MNKILIISLLFFICTYLFSNSNTESNKKKNNKGEVPIFSAIKGNISYKGIPLGGIKLTRTYPEIGKDNQVTETVITDINGDYSFDEVIGKLGVMRFLPHEAVIHQTIEAEYLEKKYIIWYACKRNYKPLGELKYLDNDPILSPEMTLAYNDSYILVNCDLVNTEEVFQKVNDNIWIYSITDFNFPYELALKEYEKLMNDRKGDFLSEINKWFKLNPNFIKDQLNKENTWAEMEQENIAPYKNVIITNVESIEFSEHISMWYFEEEYNSEIKSLNVSGELLLNVVNTKGEELIARLWLSDALFKVSKDNITLEAQEHYFNINSSTINPDILE